MHATSTGSGVRNAKEFADWLLEDENEKPAGFLDAMQLVYEGLEQSRYGL